MSFYDWYCRDKKVSADHFNFWEAHHYFWGLILMLIALYLLFSLNERHWWVQTMFWMGLWWTWDDWYQHSVQKRQIEENELKYNERFYTAHTFWNWYPYWVLRKLGLYK